MLTPIFYSPTLTRAKVMGRNIQSICHWLPYPPARYHHIKWPTKEEALTTPPNCIPQSSCGLQNTGTTSTEWIHNQCMQNWHGLAWEFVSPSLAYNFMDLTILILTTSSLQPSIKRSKTFNFTSHPTQPTHPASSLALFLDTSVISTALLQPVWHPRKS